MRPNIRKVSSHLHRHRHSESLMASYLRMQAATAEAEVAMDGGLSADMPTTAASEVAGARHVDRCQIDSLPDGAAEVGRGSQVAERYSLHVSGYSKTTQVEGEEWQAASRLGKHSRPGEDLVILSISLDKPVLPDCLP